MKKKPLKILFEILFMAGVLIAFIFAILSSQHSTSSSVVQKPPIEGYPIPIAPLKIDQATSYPIPPRPTKEATKTPTKLSTPTPQIDANGWYIYQDSKAGYSFSYPIGMRLVAYDKGYVYLWFSSLGIPGHFGIEIETRNNPDKKTAIELAMQIFEASSLKTSPVDFQSYSNAQNIVIGGKPALKVKIPAIVSDYTILIPNGDNILIINLEHDAIISSAPSEVLKSVDQILNTLKILD